jgi:hypothetical protein
MAQRAKQISPQLIDPPTAAAIFVNGIAVVASSGSENVEIVLTQSRTSGDRAETREPGPPQALVVSRIFMSVSNAERLVQMIQQLRRGVVAKQRARRRKMN